MQQVSESLEHFYSKDSTVRTENEQITLRHLKKEEEKTKNLKKVIDLLYLKEK